MNEATMRRLLIRGNTLGVTVAAVLRVLRDGGEVPELDEYEAELREWTADVRAVASEEHGDE